MRVVLDLDKLLAQGRITPAQYEEITMGLKQDLVSISY